MRTSLYVSSMVVCLLGAATHALTQTTNRTPSVEGGATLSSLVAPSVAGDTASALDPRLFCPDEIVSGVFLTVFNVKDLANTVVTYEVFSSTPGVIGFSHSPDGPFTGTLTVPLLLDANGNGTSNTFSVKALNVGRTTINACSDAPGLGCILNARDVSVLGVSTVEFVAIDSPLDTNPGPGGGLRIYPEKQYAGDVLPRHTVRVRALATEIRANLPIHFKSFDVDDPSSDSRPVDRNGVSGDDNFGVSPRLDTVAYTDASGAAELTMSVSTQPGDNFRVAASCNASYISGLQASGTDLVDAEGLTLPTPRGDVTDLLTVWRKLHVEVDSMGLVTGNQVTGMIVAASAKLLAPTSDLKVQTTPEMRLERNRFANGLIRISGLGDFKVVGNSASAVEVFAFLQADAVGRTFVLVDDDDFNGDDGFALDGDENENLFAPALTFIADGLDGVCDGGDQNVYAAAYVCPVFDVGDDNDFVPFVLNTPDSVAGKIATYDFDAAVTAADPGFWTVYLLGAYQHDTARDLDNENRGVAGAVDEINGLGASIFLETIADDTRKRGLILGCSTGFTVAHEIGHLLGGTHPHGGLMDTPCDKAVPALSGRTIATIRQLAHP